jgi:hypothetical protein
MAPSFSGASLLQPMGRKPAIAAAQAEASAVVRKSWACWRIFAISAGVDLS